MLVTFSWTNPNPLNPLISSSRNLHQLLHPETSWKTISGWGHDVCSPRYAISPLMAVVFGEETLLTPHERHCSGIV